MVLIRPGSDQHGPPRPVSVTSPPQVRYPYAGRSRVAQSAERPAVNRQVIGSSPIAGAIRSLHRQPSHLRQRRKRGNPHGAGSARADQDPHKITQPARGGPHGARPGGPGRAAAARPPRSGDGARGHPGRPPGDRAGVRDHRVPGPRGAGPLAGSLAPRTAQRQQCEAASEAKLAARLEKVTERLEADAAEHDAPGADLIAYLPGPPTGSRSSGSGPASTRIPSGGCASGSPRRSSARSSARTSRPGTCSRSSTPRPPPGRATGSRA